MAGHLPLRPQKRATSCVPAKTVMKKAGQTAIVMNMFYTGLGIARSLGERGIRVIGLSSHRGIYGNYTRYADIRFCPDSRENPDQLIEFLVKLGEELGASIIYPTRDDDVVFLDRFRNRLSSHFTPVIPASDALDACLDKWKTYLAAREAGVPTARSWKIENQEDLCRSISEISFPAVMKPISAYYWRKAGAWDQVGARKAIHLRSAVELKREYEQVAYADGRVLIQEMVPGGNENLLIAACYVNRERNLVASFTAQKLAQVPEQFGTGCVLRSVDRPELIAPTARLLETIKFSGIAEVEFKWNPSSQEFQLIEINPRPWDQHRLGHACGVDLIHLAYCDLSGGSLPAIQEQKAEYKWVAEDVMLMESIRSLWSKDGKIRSLWRLGKGKRVYAIWSASDPLPFLAYVPRHCVGEVARAGWSHLKSALIPRFSDKNIIPKPAGGDATEQGS